MDQSLKLVAMALVTAAALWGPAAAENVHVGGRVLTINPPAGFCALDRDREDDAAIYDRMDTLMQGFGQLLTYWVDCSKLAAYRSGQSLRLTPYALVAAPMSAGHVLVEDIPRKRYLDVLEGAWARAGGAEKLQAQIEGIVRERFADDAARNPQLGLVAGEMRVFGLLERDDLAVYVALGQRMSQDGDDFIMAAVGGGSIVAGVVTWVYVYEEYSEPATYDRLKTNARRMLRRLIVDNES